ncbi:MAG: MarR family transcriptional regulator [Burkholderiales bacterium]|nr:MarR family transcriptional regulator [Burkholderiales bacterium]MDE2432428.1 MarR family transcriptional regulator [Burkholderiales bacterium]HET8694642.1 MarR family transcriptional regulator [Aquabacterium sp.]
MKQKPPRLIFLLNSAQRHLQQWMALQTATLFGKQQAIPTPAQAGVLFVLAKQDGATMGHLAQELDLAPSAVSGLIQRMEALEWVARRACPDDGRTQRVWLTSLGGDQLEPLRQGMKRINQRLTAGFTEAELATVARWLRHVQQLDAADADGAPSHE